MSEWEKLYREALREIRLLRKQSSKLRLLVVAQKRKLLMVEKREEQRQTQWQA